MEPVFGQQLSIIIIGICGAGGPSQHVKSMRYMARWHDRVQLIGHLCHLEAPITEHSNGNPLLSCEQSDVNRLFACSLTAGRN